MGLLNGNSTMAKGFGPAFSIDENYTRVWDSDRGNISSASSGHFVEVLVAEAARIFVVDLNSSWPEGCQLPDC